MRLSSQQVQQIRQAIVNLGYQFEPLIDELTDHACAAIETDIKNGLPFEQASEEILGDLSEEQPHQLQANIINTLLTDRSLKQQEWQNTRWLSVGLILWILIEYGAQRLLNIPELGTAYGLLSMVILTVAIWYNARQAKQVSDGILTPRYILRSGAKLSAGASLILLLFLTFFWGYVDPTFYAGFQLDPIADSAQGLLYPTSLAGMFVGTLAEGLVVSGIYSILQHIKKD